MKRVLLMCALLLSAAHLLADEPISLKDITNGKFAAKRISGVRPIYGTAEYAQISADKKKVVKYSFATGKETGILFDLNDTQGEKIDAFDGYQMASDGRHLLIETNYKPIYRHSYTADFYVYDIQAKVLSKLSKGGAQQIPTFSPDGKKIAFVRQNNIFITDGVTEKQVTHDGKFNEVINGLPDWVNEEEFGFNNALAWSADSKTLSWIRYDESQVKTYSLQIFEGMSPARKEYKDYPGFYSYKYPKAGQDNSKVSAWVYNLESNTTQQYQLPLDADGYIPRIKTTEDPQRIIIYTMNRHQDCLRLYAATPLSGETRMLIEEAVPKYIKEGAMSDIAILKDYILLPSDRDGHLHLYLYDKEGKLIRQIEKGDYDVTAVYGYDERTGNTYFQAAKRQPMQREIYVADKKGRVTAIAGNEGWNMATFSGDYRYLLNCWSDADTPFTYTILNGKGKVIREVLNNDSLRANIAKYNPTKKEFFSFTTSEGVTLNGWMIKPSNFDPSQKYPVIMHQYSGPGSQQVVDNWNVGSMGNGGMYDYYLAQKGYIVVSVDGRGTGARGSEFEKCTYLKIGELEAKDQVEAALWLGKQTYVDSSRIGIWGWSFGGFCTLMSMSEGRNAFKAGVAIAPPTNWRYYDTVYTERYMRTPQENPDGYAINPIKRAENLHGKLLICHGLADDNVHPQNAFEYSEALIQADKDFKENYYTNRNHSIYGGNTRNHLLRQVAEWFCENL